MVGLDLICGVAADEMKDGEGTSRVGSKPLVGNADERTVKDEEMFAVEDASGNGLTRDGHVGEAEDGQCRGQTNQTPRPLIFTTLIFSPSSLFSRGHEQPFRRKSPPSPSKAVRPLSSATAPIPAAHEVKYSQRLFSCSPFLPFR